jgi:LuxR family maltose regulon positive regulatory protein
LKTAPKVGLPVATAAISMQGQADVAGFIQSFTGSHRFVLNYLVEEVLQQQPASVQAFLLRTSILDRMCGPLCDAVLGAQAGDGQAALEHLEHANLFIIPLDNARRWYRYHHLFGDLLRQRLYQNTAATGNAKGSVDELLIRASEWYEANGQEIEAFRCAAAAHDVQRAARLVEGKEMPLQFRGAAAPVLKWLETLPKTALDANPFLWVTYASTLSMIGKMDGVEGKLQAAEAVLQDASPDARTRNLIGHIAAIRALLAANQNQVDVIIAQSQRALEFLHPQNVPVRTATIWKLGLLTNSRESGRRLARLIPKRLPSARRRGISSSASRLLLG